MTLEEFLAAELQRLESRWRGGYFPALHEAFLWCAWNSQPLPAWLVDALDTQLVQAFDSLGVPGGQGRPGHRKNSEKIEKDEVRWGWVTFYRNALDLLSWELGRPAKLKDAYEAASKMLRGTPAQGEADAIEEAYARVQKIRKKSTP